jgi:hypothetical protein
VNFERENDKNGEIFVDLKIGFACLTIRRRLAKFVPLPFGFSLF